MYMACAGRSLSQSWPIIVGWLKKITGGYSRLAYYFLGGGWTVILSAASRLSHKILF